MTTRSEERNWPSTAARLWRERLRPRLRGRPLTRLRKALAFLLLAGALVLAIFPSASDGDPGTATVVSARDLTPGSTLDDADLRTVSMPGPLRPEGAFSSPDAVRGKLLAGSARAGEPITDLRLAEAMHAPGSATVPVRLADAGVAGLLHPGTRVDVVTADSPDAGRRILASMATVVTVVADADSPDTKKTLATAGKGPLVLIAVAADTAVGVAAASLGHPVTVTLR